MKLYSWHHKRAQNTYMERTETSLPTSFLATWAFGRGYNRAKCALTLDFLERTERVNTMAYGLKPLLMMPAAVCVVLWSLYWVASYESGGMCFAIWKMETLMIKMIAICQHLAQQMEIAGETKAMGSFRE